MTQSMELAAKRRKERLEEDRLAANEAEERRRATPRAQQEALQARLAFAEQQMAQRTELGRRRAALSHAKHVQRWLQTQYPVELAESMIGWYTGLRHLDRENYTKEVDEMLKSGFSAGSHPTSPTCGFRTTP